MEAFHLQTADFARARWIDASTEGAGQVLLAVLAGQDELGEMPEVRPPPRLSDGLQNGKIALTMRARGPPGRRAQGEIKAVAATPAGNQGIVRRRAWKDVSASGRARQNSP